MAMRQREDLVASSKSNGLSMHVAAVNSVFSPTFAKYFINMFAPYSQPTAINVIHGLALLMNYIVVEISSLLAVESNLQKT